MIKYKQHLLWKRIKSTLGLDNQVKPQFVGNSQNLTLEPLEPRLLLDGATFGPDSDDFSDLDFVHMQDGSVLFFTGQGDYSLSSFMEETHAEEFLGVNCLKFEVTAVDTGLGMETQEVVVAQDTSGKGWIFRYVQDGQTFFEADAIQDAVSFAESPFIQTRLISGNYRNGTITTSPDGDTHEIISTSATLPQFPGYRFIKTKWTSPNGRDVDWAYYHESVGRVLELWDDSGDPYGEGWILKGFGKTPDIKSVSLDVTPVILAPGERIQCFRNYEISDAPIKDNFNIEYHLSTDSTWGNSDDITSEDWTETVSYPYRKDVGSHGGPSFYMSLELPSEGLVPDQTYYVLARLDSDNEIDEQYENNNSFISNQLTYIQPDLSWDSLTCSWSSDGTLMATHNFNVSDADVRDTFSIRYSFSKDLVWGNNDYGLGNEFVHTADSTIGTHSKTFNLTGPGMRSQIEPYFTYLLAKIDDRGDISESNEHNNIIAVNLADSQNPNLPPDVSLLSPEDGYSDENTMPSFDWESNDPEEDTLSHTLYISHTDLPPFFSKNVGTDTTYTLSEAEALSVGDYYWTVKAVDTHGNDTTPANAWALVVEGSNLPPTVEPTSPKSIAVTPKAMFRWSTDDPDGDTLSSTLYISSDATPFTDPLFTKEVGTETEYILSGSEVLNSGNYYWGVRVDDGHMNMVSSSIWPFDVVGDNLPPTVELLSPGVTTAEIQPTFRWSADDPNDDILTSTLYISNDTTPFTDPLLTVNVGADNEYTLLYSEALEVDTYSWAVEVDDGQGHIIVSTVSLLEVFPQSNNLTYESNLSGDGVLVYSSDYALTHYRFQDAFDELTISLTTTGIQSALGYLIEGTTSGFLLALNDIWGKKVDEFDPVRVMPVGPDLKIENYAIKSTVDVTSLTTDEYTAVVFLDFIDAGWNDQSTNHDPRNFSSDLELTAGQRGSLGLHWPIVDQITLLSTEQLHSLDADKSYALIPRTYFDVSDLQWEKLLLSGTYTPTDVFLEATVHKSIVSYEDRQVLTLNPQDWVGTLDGFENSSDDWVFEGDVSVVDDGSSENNVCQLAEGSDAAISQTVALPDDVSELIFDYHFVHPGDGDSLVATINGQQVWAQAGTDYNGTSLLSSEPIDVSVWAGQTIELELRLSSIGQKNCQIWLDNVTIFADAGPQAELNASDFVTVAGLIKGHEFPVQYTDDTSLDIDSIDNSDIRVMGPNGYDDNAELVKVDVADDGFSCTATYLITPSADVWNENDFGTYEVWIQPNEIANTNGLFATAESLGTFAVNSAQYSWSLGGKAKPSFAANNCIISLSLKGPGGGVVFLPDPSQPEILEIELNNTSNKSSLVIKTKNGEAQIKSIFSHDSLKSITAKTVDLDGNIKINGSLDNLLLDDILENSRVTTSHFALKGINLKADNIKDNVDFDISGWIKKLQANKFSSGSIIADGIYNITVKEGDFGADVKTKIADIAGISTTGDITGNISAAGYINKIIAKQGDFTGVARAAKSINSLQAINLDSAVLSTGDDINKVNVKGNILDSYLLAGYDIGSDCAFGLQETDGHDSPGYGNIDSVTAKGEFARSYICAGVLPIAPLTESSLLDVALPYTTKSGVIGKIKFGNIDYVNASDDFGLYAASSIKPFKMGKETAQSQGYFKIEVVTIT